VVVARTGIDFPVCDRSCRSSRQSLRRISIPITCRSSLLIHSASSTCFDCAMTNAIYSLCIARSLTTTCSTEQSGMPPAKYTMSRTGRMARGINDNVMVSQTVKILIIVYSINLTVYACIKITRCIMYLFFQSNSDCVKCTLRIGRFRRDSLTCER
jgi:hypothetical protein